HFDYHRATRAAQGGSDFAHATSCSNAWITDQTDLNLHVLIDGLVAEHRVIDVEDSVPWAVVGESENRLALCDHLANLSFARCDCPRAIGAQFRLSEGVMRHPKLRLGCFERTFAGSKQFLGTIILRLRSRFARQQKLLPLKRGSGIAKLCIGSVGLTFGGFD